VRFALPILLTLLSAVCAKSKEGGQLAVARVGDVVITLGELQERLSKYAQSSQFLLARYSSLEKKREFLEENMVRLEVLALEARRRGYDKDPEAQKAPKQKLVALLLKREIDDKITAQDVSDADVETYYREHQRDFVRPEAVRVSHILTRDEARARKVAALAKAAPKADAKAFRDLVARYSEDHDSKQRGGDLMTFDRETNRLPKPVVDAAFALEDINDVSGAIQTDQGFVVLKLTDRRPGFSKRLDDVKGQIQLKLVDSLRKKRAHEFMKETCKKMKVEIYEDQLARVVLPQPTSLPAAGSPPAGAKVMSSVHAPASPIQ
jgi:peptidyl-prolyl cis-trans isomerase C